MISDISDISDDIRRDAPGLLPDASKNTEKRRSVNSRSQKSNTKKNTSPDAGRQSLDAYGLLTKEQSSRVNTPIFARDRRCVASEPRHNMTEMQSIGDIISNTGEPSISLRSSETPLISPEDYIQILGRQQISTEIKHLLDTFDENLARGRRCEVSEPQRRNMTDIQNIGSIGRLDNDIRSNNYKRGIYIYGPPGSGKSEFIANLLKSNNYDMIKFDSGDVRNKSLIDTISSNNIGTKNILEMMYHRVKRVVICMDEVEGLSLGDRQSLTALIKLIRQKKTKKQRVEDITLNPIICIGNYFMDKKIRELMKVCNVFELKPPTDDQVSALIDKMHNNICRRSQGQGHPIPVMDPTIKQNMIQYIRGDLRKLECIQNIYNKKPDSLAIFHKILKSKTLIEDSKKTTQLLIQKPISISRHNEFMNETDRTIVALLWHENIVDALSNSPIERAFPFYGKILDNMCYADYIDRITFQNQIWQFNEMSSMMKTFYNNKLFHDHFPENGSKYTNDEIRFTKVLTKYSTEYNNQLFIYNICQILDADKKDMISFFQELRILYGSDFLSRPDLSAKIEEILENLNINKLDMKRIYRYLDKNVKKDGVLEDDYVDGECD